MACRRVLGGIGPAVVLCGTLRYASVLCAYSARTLRVLCAYSARTLRVLCACYSRLCFNATERQTRQLSPPLPLPNATGPQKEIDRLSVGRALPASSPQARPGPTGRVPQRLHRCKGSAAAASSRSTPRCSPSWILPGRPSPPRPTPLPGIPAHSRRRYREFPLTHAIMDSARSAVSAPPDAYRSHPSRSAVRTRRGGRTDGQHTKPCVTCGAWCDGGGLRWRIFFFAHLQRRRRACALRRSNAARSRHRAPTTRPAQSHRTAPPPPAPRPLNASTFLLSAARPFRPAATPLLR
jgi:hypothetical protein